jgi:hypothetical protein
LDHFLVSLRRRVGTLQESITRDVRDHSATRSHTAKAITSASSSISELFGKIALIKDKASQSEVMVQEICRDIRSLDTAKKHLTNTIRALRNLHMLVSAVGQLDFMVAEKQYKLAAERLRAIQDLFTLFEAYGDVPKIRSLRASVDATKALMKEQLTAEFHRVLPSPLVAQEPQASLMSDACLVVDVLDGAFKSDLLQWSVHANTPAQPLTRYGIEPNPGSMALPAYPAHFPSRSGDVAAIARAHPPNDGIDVAIVITTGIASALPFASAAFSSICDTRAAGRASPQHVQEHVVLVTHSSCLDLLAYTRP